MTTKSELISKLMQKNPEISAEDMLYIISETFDYIGSELKDGNRVEIRGFGSFEVNEKKIVSPLAQDSGAIRKVVRYKQSTRICSS